ncbi:glycine--tRNA ligase [Candidatus Dojkabacteria bacterium]|uniref:glycine--tRNA ligase n=1 Tax=Candidatus Dojkabacteria bacterium TaxID=2099670 RepID=A0A955L9Q6_9BACT|nr:glycine--tRNA ligase [Candidatus Dojkabacteria bacterium]
MNKHATLEKIVSWAKRRGFVFQTSSIYGGLANNYDYGPYGTLLKNNIQNFWWKTFVQEREDIVGLDGAIITQADVWKASGHVDNFNDPLVDDKVNRKRYRADHLIEEWNKKNDVDLNVEAMSVDEMTTYIKENKILSPDGNEITDARTFGLMFETFIGATSSLEDGKVYLRPETAQSIFANFKNVIDTMRVKVPFGIAQVGKAFRNEITKGQFIFRTIETEQMEIEYFISPQEDWEKLYAEWQDEMLSFYKSITHDAESDLRYRKHDDEELSHYSKQTYDVEYEFDFGFKEVAGFAHRGDFDLSQHKEASKQKLEYRDPYTNEVYVPHVLEPSFGLARAVLVAMYSAYTEEDLGEGKSRVVMKFPKHIAPVTAAIFPLQKDEKLQTMAHDVYLNLRGKFDCEFDNSGNIGKMYRRQDEIGTPFCIVVDHDSIDDNCVTIRDRDTMEQERVAIDDLEQWISSNI